MVLLNNCVLTMAYSPPDSVDELLKRWHKRLRESQFAHYESAKMLSRANLGLGIPVVIFSTLVGTSVFATIQSNPNLLIQITLGLLSMVAAVLASLQTFFRYSERAEKHRGVGARYGAIRREIEQVIANPQTEYSNAKETLDSLRTKIDSLADEAPEVSSQTWKRVLKQLETGNIDG
jgi:peptidoglycan hydrolase CwlO-like protein